MKRTLRITIDADRVTCGACEHLSEAGAYSKCAIFGGLEQINSGSRPDGSAVWLTERAWGCVASEQEP